MLLSAKGRGPKAEERAGLSGGLGFPAYGPWPTAFGLA